MHFDRQLRFNSSFKLKALYFSAMLYMYILNDVNADIKYLISHKRTKRSA